MDLRIIAMVIFVENKKNVDNHFVTSAFVFEDGNERNIYFHDYFILLLFISVIK